MPRSHVWLSPDGGNALYPASLSLSQASPTAPVPTAFSPLVYEAERTPTYFRFCSSPVSFHGSFVEWLDFSELDVSRYLQTTFRPPTDPPGAQTSFRVLPYMHRNCDRVGGCDIFIGRWYLSGQRVSAGFSSSFGSRCAHHRDRSTLKPG